MKKGYKKGQAVMEYLITYGLALFVIMIVLAILVAVVLPSLQAPATCQFTQPGFGCAGRTHVIVADIDDNIRIHFQLDNQQGQNVKVLDVLCTNAVPGDVRKSAFEDTWPEAFSEQMNAGSTLSFGSPISDVPLEVPCYDEDGNQLVLPAGTNFRGSIGVIYEFEAEVEGAPSRLAVATVTGNIVAEE